MTKYESGYYKNTGGSETGESISEVREQVSETRGMERE